MELILTDYNYKNLVGPIEVYRPSRGFSGTLSYGIKLDGNLFSFELNDDGYWVPEATKQPMSLSISEHINELICELESLRLCTSH
jgi:hypothetical protein